MTPYMSISSNKTSFSQLFIVVATPLATLHYLKHFNWLNQYSWCLGNIFTHTNTNILAHLFVPTLPSYNTHIPFLRLLEKNIYL